MVPGNYIIDGKKYHINSKGFRGDDFKKPNLKKLDEKTSNVSQEQEKIDQS